MSLNPHSPSWYDRLANTQAGYYYPWKSHLPRSHGEDVFKQMLNQYISPTSDVLEVACAHGALSLEIAPHCRSITAYDRVASWIEQAKNAAGNLDRPNVTFVCHDSSLEANGGQARLPAADNSCDLLICSKGPFHWVEDARRVARPGAVLLMLVPDIEPVTSWHAELPKSLQWKVMDDPNWARAAIEDRLVKGGLALGSWWSFDVPEIFTEPEELYEWLRWGSGSNEVPPLVYLQDTLESIFNVHGNSGGVEIRHRRHIWKAIAMG